MGVLSKVFSSLTTVTAPSTSNNAISTIGLKTSDRAIKVLGESGTKSASQLHGSVLSLSGKKLSQEAQLKLTEKLSEIESGAQILQYIAPKIASAAKEWEKGEAAKTKALETVAASTQKVAVLNAETQATMFVGHVKASNEIRQSQKNHAMWGGI